MWDHWMSSKNKEKFKNPGNVPCMNGIASMLKISIQACSSFLSRSLNDLLMPVL